MPTTGLLLERLLNTPDLATIVPQLHPQVLHRVLQVCGLEDCAEVVALATPEQISRVLDLDLWRAHGRGGDEELDADRFGLWLEVLMQSGAAVAAEKVIGLDLALVTAGLSQHAEIFSCAAGASYTMLDGTFVQGRSPAGEMASEIGGYVISARRTTSWDAIVELLTYLQSNHPEYFGRLIGGCLPFSNGAREPNGFHDLLEDGDQDLFDLASEREARREKQGYVSPAQARAFLQGGRQLRLDGDPPPPDPVARAFFRAIEIDPADSAPVVDILGDAGVFTAPPLALLGSGDTQAPPLAWIDGHLQSHPASMDELAYLANALIAGGVVQGRAFAPKEASAAAMAISNLGLENWPHKWPSRDVVTAFHVGWRILHHDVCIFAARRLIEVLASLECADRDIQLRLNGLRRELKRALKLGAPWQARHALDVIVMLDAPSWAALGGLLDECPVLHAAVGASGRGLRAIDPAAFEFIASSAQIAEAREFLASLPSRLID